MDKKSKLWDLIVTRSIELRRWLKIHSSPSKNQGPVWQSYLNIKLHILNDITYIFIHFFTHMYIKNTQITLFKLTHQQVPRICELLLVYRQYQYRMDLTGFFQDWQLGQILLMCTFMGSIELNDPNRTCQILPS